MHAFVAKQLLLLLRSWHGPTRPQKSSVLYTLPQLCAEHACCWMKPARITHSPHVSAPGSIDLGVRVKRSVWALRLNVRVRNLDQRPKHSAAQLLHGFTAASGELVHRVVGSREQARTRGSSWACASAHTGRGQQARSDAVASGQ